MNKKSQKLQTRDSIRISIFRRYLLAYLFGCRIYHRWNCADDAHYFPVHANDRSFVYRNRIYALYSKNS